MTTKDELFEDQMVRLVGTLNEEFAESHRLEEAIRVNLGGLGYSS